MLPTNQLIFWYQASPRIFGKKNLIIPPDPPGSKHLQGIGFILSLFTAATSRTHPPGSEWHIGSAKLGGNYIRPWRAIGKGYYVPLKWWPLCAVCLISGTLATFWEFSVWGHPKIMMFYDFSLAELEPWSIICSLLPINIKHIPEKKHTGHSNTLQTARLQSQSCSYLEGRSLRFA